MDETIERLADLRDRLREVVPGGFDEVLSAAGTDEQIVELLRLSGELSRQAESLLVAAAGRVRAESSGPRDERLTTRLGCASPADLLRRATLCDQRQAATWTKAAAAVRRDVSPSSGEALPGMFPALREAVRDGAVSASGVVAATGGLRAAAPRIDTADLVVADRILAAAARGVDPDDLDEHGAVLRGAPGRWAPMDASDLRSLADALVTRLDQDGSEPSQERALRDRGLRFGVRTLDGLIPVRGALLPDVAGQLQLLLDAVTNPHGPDRNPDTGAVAFTPDDHAYRDGAADSDGRLASGGDGGGDGEGPSPGDTLVVHDDRTRAQKLHDALAVILTLAARSAEAPTIGGAAPTLVVSVSAEDYAAGRFAHIDGIGAVPGDIARHAACGGTIERVVHDRHGRIVDIGISGRIFNAAQRRAIIARDGTCIIPGCPVPARWCEIHHVTDHARGGPTHTDNGVPLCWFHHRTLERSGWDITMRHGLPHIRGPAWWDPHRRYRPASRHPGHGSAATVRRRAGSAPPGDPSG